VRTAGVLDALDATRAEREAEQLRGSVPAHDACCVALARALGCPLVTGDLRPTRAPGLGVPLVAV
jgi:predicted nucleic acid-binding protein